VLHHIGDFGGTRFAVLPAFEVDRFNHVLLGGMAHPIVEVKDFLTHLLRNNSGISMVMFRGLTRDSCLHSRGSSWELSNIFEAHLPEGIMVDQVK
jgi:hypothetical protein